MTAAPTYCRDCENVHPASRDEHKPWQWRCLKFPRPSGYGFVHPEFSLQPPYHSCRDINVRGECEHFTPHRKLGEPSR